MRLTIAIGAAIALLAVITVAILHISARVAHACSRPAIPLEVTISHSDSIFRGQVISIDRQIVDSDEMQREIESIVVHGGGAGDVQVTAYEDIIEFRVSEVWKGVLRETVYFRSTWEDIKTPHPLPCPRESQFYVKGASYLVFAGGGQANIGRSTATRRIESATLLLRELGAGKPPIPGLVGPIPERKGQPVTKQPRGGCGLTYGYSPGSVNLSAVGLTAMLGCLWLRRRVRR